MLSRNLLVAAALLQFAFSAFAKQDVMLDHLFDSAKPTYDLRSDSGKETYHDFVYDTLSPKMKQIAKTNKSKKYAQDLADGKGVSVQLSDSNYNIHVDFPNAETGGRSYGWTSGAVGDWTDKMYLDGLSDVVSERSSKDLHKFYEWIVEVLGSCDPDDKGQSIEALNATSQHVASNFLAIYTAEEYRATVASRHNWDDALLQVTMLGAFHGGQSKFTKFYLGEFTDKSKEQGPGVYDNKAHKPGPTAKKAKDKDAELNDYWQNSRLPNSMQSGINITRNDFQLMGEAITSYERDVAHNKNLGKIEDVVGKSKNVIAAVSQYFTKGEAKPDETDDLAQAVADFMIDIRGDADDITKWEQNGEK